jgi:hypothetical protein
MKARVPIVNQVTALDRVPREQLIEQIKILAKKLEDARVQAHGVNALFAALVKEKHGGRAFVQISSFAETQGWCVDMLPQKALGNVRILAIDGNGHAQIADDVVMAPTDVPCCFEDDQKAVCGAPATFAEGTDENDRPINPRCSAHLPEGAQIDPTKPIPTGAAAAKPEPEAVGCSGCGRKVGHNLDCPRYNEN